MSDLDKNLWKYVYFIFCFEFVASKSIKYLHIQNTDTRFIGTVCYYQNHYDIYFIALLFLHINAAEVNIMCGILYLSLKIFYVYHVRSSCCISLCLLGK